MLQSRLKNSGLEVITQFPNRLVGEKNIIDPRNNVESQALQHPRVALQDCLTNILQKNQSISS